MYNVCKFFLFINFLKFVFLLPKYISGRPASELFLITDRWLLVLDFKQLLNKIRSKICLFFDNLNYY